MAETPEPVSLDDPFAPGLPFEQRLRALESAWAQPRPDPPGADQRMTGQATGLESLAAELAACRTQMRDQEKALVERIADVDDDRRLTSAQLQRGWQAQRDEFQARLRRGAGRTALALGLVLALVGGGLLALYTHEKTAQATLAEQVATLRQDLQRLSGVRPQDAQVQEQLASLSAVVGQLSTGLGEITDRLHQTPPSPGQDNSPLAGDIARLAAGEEHLTGELESLKRALESLVSGLHAQSAPAVTGAKETPTNHGQRAPSRRQ
jgi:DamX protein